MNYSTKRRIAIEILIFFTPVIILPGLAGLSSLYLNNKFREQMRDLDDEIIIIRAEMNMKIDSVKKADSVEWIRLYNSLIKRNDSESKALLEEATEFIRNKKYSQQLLTNIYSDTIPTAYLFDRRDDVERRRQYLYKPSYFEHLRDEYLPIYILILIILYPIRAIILAMLWAVRTIREKKP